MTISSPDDEQRRQRSLDTYQILDSLPEQVFDELIGLVANVCQVPMAMLSFIDENRQWFKASVGLDLSETPRSIAFCDHVVRSRAMVIVTDATTDERFVNNPFVVNKPNIRFYAGVPLIADDGSAIGSLAVLDSRERRLTHSRQKALKSFAQLAMHELELRRARLNLEAALAQRDELAERLTATLETITDAFFTLDRAWRFTYLNRQAEELMGFDRDDLLGRVLWDVYPDAVDSPFYEYYRKATEIRERVDFEYRQEESGQWFGFTVYPADDGLAVYFRDVTERHLARQQAEESAERMRGVLETAQDAIITIDEAGRIESVNPATSRMFGYEPGELLGKDVRMLMPESYRSQHENHLNRYLATGEARIMGKAQQLTALRKDGREFPIVLSVSEIFLAGRRAFTGFIQDITEQRALEGQLQQVQRLESVGQLTGGIAHDFNNLLTVIIGNAELLSENTESNPELHHLAQTALTAARRGVDLTNRLLAFARRQRLEPRSIDLTELVTQMRPLLSQSVTEAVELKIVHAPDLWWVEIDPGQLESALLNLALNARDAMPDGGRLLIETSNVQLNRDYVDSHVDVEEGDYVQISVTDSGQGISAKNLGRVFEPFFTTKAHGKGTGLGLPMVYGFVKQSRGHISIYSEPGEGTTVRMYLPPASRTSEKTSPPASDAQLLAGSERILVVEDDELVREHVERVLTQLGYQVVTAADGHAALALVDQQGPFDLLFSDVIMPGGIKGTELMEMVREKQPDIAVLLTSGYTENAVIDDSKSGRPTLLLQKPYQRLELARLVRAALDQRDRH